MSAWDVIVIGSGAGGGTVAAALAPLAEAGRRVLVVERGPRLGVAHARPDELASADAFYAGAGAAFTEDGTIALATGQVLGGSTALSTGVAVGPSGAVIDGWRVPGLPGADIEARAAAMVRDAGAAYPHDATLNENNRLFEEGALRAGFSPERMRLLVRGCRGAGVCHLGCPNDAVLGTHALQLPRAAAAGVRFVTRARAVAIAPQQVVVRVTADEGWPAGDHVLTAPCIVLAAGAIETTGLLLRGGFGGALPRLGRGVTCHPAHVVVAEHPRAITNAVGHPTAYRVDRTTEDGYVLEPCFSSPLVTARNLTGFGPEHAQVLAAYPRLQMLRVTARDRAADGNRVVLDRDGEAIVRYRLAPSVRDALVAGQRAAARVAFGAGAVRVHVPAADPPRLDRHDMDALDRRISAALELPGRVSLSATQPLGGAAMSRGPRDGVTDAHGRVHGAPWLRIADGSLCPDSPGVHPVLTIMALAERVADAVRDDLPALAGAAPAVA